MYYSSWNTLYNAKNEGSLNIKLGGTYINHLVLKVSDSILVKIHFRVCAKRDIIIFLTHTQEIQNVVCIWRLKTFLICRSACSQTLLSRRSIQRGVVITQQFPYNSWNIIFLIFVIVLLRDQFFIFTLRPVTLSHRKPASSRTSRLVFRTHVEVLDPCLFVCSLFTQRHLQHGKLYSVER